MTVQTLWKRAWGSVHGAYRRVVRVLIMISIIVNISIVFIFHIRFGTLDLLSNALPLSSTHP